VIPESPPPALGEHTDGVLRRLGFNDEDRSALYENWPWAGTNMGETIDAQWRILHRLRETDGSRPLAH